MNNADSKQTTSGQPQHETFVTVRGDGREALIQQVFAGAHCLVSDEPTSMGGGDEGPSPYDLLLGALGSCTSMTMVLYARRKEWPLELVTIHLRHSRGPEGERIDREIHMSGDLTPEQQDRLMDIANKCPVHRTLLSPNLEIRTRPLTLTGE